MSVLFMIGLGVPNYFKVFFWLILFMHMSFLENNLKSFINDALIYNYVQLFLYPFVILIMPSV